MGDLSDYANQLLFSYLQPEKPNFAVNDPYGQLARLTESVSQQIPYNDPDYSLGEKIAATALTGLIGGGFQGLSSDYQGRAKKAYLDVMLGNENADAEDILTSDLYRSAGEAKSIFDLAKAEKTQEQTAARSNEIFKSMLNDPYKTRRGLKYYEQLINKDKTEPIVKIPERLGESDSTIGKEPLSISEKLDRYLEDTGGDETLARSLLEKELEKPDKLLTASDALRKELAANKEIIEFAEIRNKIEVLAEAALDPRSSADLDYIYAIAKILDPGAVVRESDAGMVIESQSIPASTLGYINKLARGESALDRPALFDLAKRHYDTRSKKVGSLLDRYETLAKSRGLDPVQVLPFTRDYLTLPTPEIKPTQGKGGGADATLINQLRLIVQKRKTGAPLSPGEKEVLAKARKLAGE